MEPTDAIPKGGDDPNGLVHLDNVSGGELPTTSPESGDALDKLFAEQQAAKEAPKPTSEPEKAAVTPSPDPAVPPVTLPVADPAAPAIPPPAPETYESVEPPPNIKPKTAESFAKIKTLAKLAVTAAEERATKAEARALELETASKDVKALTPEAEKELNELRTFRKSIDIESDPEFKQFDTKIAANEETILTRLKAAGATDELLAKVKEIGVADVNWDELASKLPHSLRRLVDAKLVENESLAEQKKAAITTAKANADAFLKTRTEAQTQKATERQELTKQTLDEHLPKMAWLAAKPVPKDAKPEEKAALEAHNKLVAETKEDIAQALQDDSPQMRAILVLGYSQLKRVRADLEAFQSTAAAEKKASDEKLVAANKELDEAKKFIERIKGSSTARLHSSAPSSDEPKPVKVNTSTDPGEALDAIRDQILARKNNQQD